jgi:hypothetical protein
MTDNELIELYKQSQHEYAQVDNSLPPKTYAMERGVALANTWYAASELKKRGYILDDNNNWHKPDED